ncbi:MAG: hypothetical protein ACI4T3_07155 [Lactobacillus sp.]
MMNEIYSSVTIIAVAIIISIILDALGKFILRSAIKKANLRDKK